MKGYIRNRSRLLSHGAILLRQSAVEIADAAIAAADPGPAIRRLLRIDSNRLSIGDHTFDLDDATRIFVIGAGKATFPIAKALDDILGRRIYRGLITCKEGQPGTLEYIELHLASHPIPNEASLDAALRTRSLLSEVGPGDIVVSCFTGGSSALFVQPLDGISLQDKIAANRLLLGCGANIVEINAVRKHLSQVKGGRLARSLPPGARLVTLTVSDVIGDRLDCISDPSVADASTFADARATLDKYGLWRHMPPSIRHCLKRGSTENETARTSDLAHLERAEILLVKSDTACLAAAEAAQSRGFLPLLLSTYFDGESRELGRFVAAIAKQIIHDSHPAERPCVLISGGETTVVLGRSCGKGGPNQEFAAALAVELDGFADVASLAIDTDGTDGPTQFAGALVDGTTAARARALRIDLAKRLDQHDVAPALDRLDDLIVTDATGTNVNDLRLTLIGPPRNVTAAP